MKLATLTTTAILAIFAATEARSIEAPRTDMVKRYWTRLRFSAEDYYPKSSLEKKKLKSYTAKIDDWSAEDWAAFILLKCKDADGCASCVAYQGKYTLRSLSTLPAIRAKIPIREWKERELLVRLPVHRTE